MEEELKTILREAFGDSSSDSDGESTGDRPGRLQVNDSREGVLEPHSVFGDSHIWEPIKEINGLWICRDFLSAEQQSSLLSALERVQAMRFGELPPWAIELSCNIREDILFSSYFSDSMDPKPANYCKETCIFPPDLLYREPLFNQLIVNIYQPGEGICAHVDLMRFEDGIAIVSLESSCVMHFSSVTEEFKDNCTPSSKIPILLTPGSLILMWGDARYLWKHEINRKPGFQNWEGLEIDQKRRTSVTLRRLCPME